MVIEEHSIKIINFMKNKLKKGGTVRLYNINMKHPIPTIFTVGEVFEDSFEATCGSYVQQFKKGKLPSKYVVFSKDRIYTPPPPKPYKYWYFDNPHSIRCDSCGSHNTTYVGDDDHFCYDCNHMTNW